MARRRNMKGKRIGYNGRTSGPKHLKSKVPINAFHQGIAPTGDWNQSSFMAEYYRNPQWQSIAERQGMIAHEGIHDLHFFYCALCCFIASCCDSCSCGCGDATESGGNGPPKIRRGNF